LINFQVGPRKKKTRDCVGGGGKAWAPRGPNARGLGFFPNLRGDGTAKPKSCFPPAGGDGGGRSVDQGPRTTPWGRARGGDH